MGDMRQAIEGVFDYKIRVEQQITQLKADLAKCEKAYHDVGEFNDKLRINLAKFAGHTAECHKRTFWGWLIGVFAKCDCGYDKKEGEWSS